MRTKIYNKFLQTISSAAITDTFISTNIQYMAKPNDLALHQSFMNTREVGTSRIEFTTYTGKLPELAKLYGYLDKVLDLCVQHGDFRAVPHREVW